MGLVFAGWTDGVAALVLWVVALGVFAAAVRAFARRDFAPLALLGPAFWVCAGGAAWIAFGPWGAGFWLVALLEGAMVASCVLFLLDAVLGLWAFDMTYPAMVSWVVGPVVLVVTGVASAVSAMR
jgi:hypothetical protein